jgi:tetratricopeptide (TPR) repeat protein
MAVSAPATDFGRDLDRVADELRRLESESPGAARATGIANCLYRRACLTGSFEDLAYASAATDAALAEFPAWPDLSLVAANIHFKLHRLADVRADLDRAPELAASPEGRALAADLDFEEGRYDEARRRLEELVAADRSWGALARLAHLELELGDADAADALYAEAAAELTAKELRSYCWIELKRGEIDVSRGRYEEAESHYARAAATYSGDWSVDEHVAELRAAQGRFEDAIALYESVVERVPRPELQQALGDVHAFAGEPDRAVPWHDLALEGYLASVAEGDVHYFHHLADFEARVEPRDAVRWARADVELRRNPGTLAVLARALQRERRGAEAAVARNPRRGDFHVHR